MPKTRLQLVKQLFLAGIAALFGRDAGRRLDKIARLRAQMSFQPTAPRRLFPLTAALRGRRGHARAFAGALKPDRARQTVLLFVHEASRTGAPIFAWNLAGRLSQRFNVVVVLMRGGAIESAFFQVATAVHKARDVSGEFTYRRAAAIVGDVIAAHRPAFAIINSASAGWFAPELGKRMVPVIALVHEFSSFYRPRGTLEPLYRWASAIVFPSRVTAEASLADYHTLLCRNVVVATPGRCAAPVIDPADPVAREVAEEAARKISASDTGRATLADLPPPGEAFLVVGMGAVDYRKGVDIFLATASEVMRIAPDAAIRFAWVGSRYYPGHDPYSAYLAEQIERAGLPGRVLMIDELTDVAPVYARAGVFYLSSRVDPMPNVAIDAAVAGVPVLCFDHSTGIAEFLAEHEALRSLILPYLDAGAAARRIVALAADPAERAALAAAIGPAAQEHFDMTGYVDRVIGLGLAGVRLADQQKRDFDVILASRTFDPETYLGQEAGIYGTRGGIAHYLVQSTLLDPMREPVWGFSIRRPMPGFHPLRYARECAAFPAESGENPLAHYLRSGRPDGPWTHEVITPGPKPPAMPSPPRVAIHGHFHYPELLSDMLRRLERNTLACDLFLTTTSQEKALALAEASTGFARGEVHIRALQNRGRDIGAFIAELAEGRFAGYELVAHVHGKRSPHTASAAVSERWRELLWQNAIGGRARMADIIVDRFRRDPSLGLVFPEDQHLVGWDKNRKIAEALAARLGLGSLPVHIDLPVGTMFWARVAALTPLLDLGLSWTDYPEEPAPIDGTILHALERLMPFIVAKAGFRYAATRVPGVFR